MPPRRNGVMGPASALTSFLRDQGITARHGTGYQPNAPGAAGVPSENGEPTAASAGEASSSSGNAQAGPGPSSAGTSRSSRSAAAAGTLDAVQLQALQEAEEAIDEDDLPVPGGKRRKVAQVASDSSDLDRSDSGAPSYTPAQKKVKALAKKRAAAAKASQRLANADDDDGGSSDDDDSDDVDKAPPAKRVKGGPPAKKPAAGGGGAPQIGSRLDCGDCAKIFTYSKYSPPAPLDPDLFLCHVCAKDNGLGNYKGPGKAAAPKKKAERRQVVHYEAKDRVPHLTDLCIAIVARHVEDVESLGEIGPDNLRKVNNIICKNRKMTTHTATLFYDASVTDLTMKDCTLIDGPGFETLAGLCPSLQTLHLSLCGQMSSASLLALAKLRHLRRLELYAPFLVRADAWAAFFQRMGEREGGGLEGLLVRNSPRLDEKALEALVKYNPGLRELRLSQVEKFSESWLPTIAKLKHLTLLDISYPSRSLDESTPVGGAPLTGAAAVAAAGDGGLMGAATADPAPAPALPAEVEDALAATQAKTDDSAHAVVGLLASLGPTLTHLSLAGHSFVTAGVLAASVGAHCPNLTHVDLSDLPLLTDDDTAAFVAGWNPKRLVDARFKACHDLGGATLDAVLALDGGPLERLDLAGWKDCAEDVLKTIGVRKGRALRELDVGWCRNVTDFTLKDIVDHAPALEQLRVWGCNLVSRAHPRRKGLQVVGVESHEFGSSALA